MKDQPFPPEVLDAIIKMFPTLANPAALARLRAAYVALCAPVEVCTLEKCREVEECARALVLLASVSLEARALWESVQPGAAQA